MSVMWYAINHETMTYFKAPKEFGFNKAHHVHNPTNPFAHMVMYMNEKNDGMNCKIYEIQNDVYHQVLLKDKTWNDYEDVTDKVYEEFLDFWNEYKLEHKLIEFKYLKENTLNICLREGHKEALIYLMKQIDMLESLMKQIQEG